MSDTRLFARVILPLAVKGLYTYAVPDEFTEHITAGCRVLVSFGQKRLYCAVVHSLVKDEPAGFTPKPILDLLDPVPAVTGEQLRIWEWMSSYYMCTQGEVMRAALPSGLRPESESRVRINADFEERGELDNSERLLFEVVKDQGEVTLGDLDAAGIGRNPVVILKRLVDMGAVEINEFIRSTVPQKKVIYIRLAPSCAKEDALHGLLDTLERAPRQKALLEKYLQLVDPNNIASSQPVLKRALLEDQPGGSGALASLIRKGFLEQVIREETDHSSDCDPVAKEPSVLSEEQTAALAEIRQQFGEHQAVLLQGATSSGKTEIYIHLIRETIEKGRQVLYMLPEIALTTQIIRRIRQVFGDQVGVYHSRHSDSDRVHLYRNLLGLTDEEPYRVVIGVRSAIFLPFRSLGLIIIDEEHENTYKQFDPAPRYHARDSAQILALYHNARVLLGSATPSFESLYNARNQKYGHVSLHKRYGDVLPPLVEVADVRTALKRKQMVSHFTPGLARGIREAMEAGEQVILFQNRRGYSNYLICGDCGHIPRCSRCDVSLTFHRQSGKLECHYCGHKEAMRSSCSSCGETHMIMRGFGTEKIEDEIAVVFEGIRTGRLDADAARSVSGYEKVIRSFERGELDMLIGTQMLSKGLDFENVGLVGVLDADSMLNFPDFRSFERSFQLIWQVGGRSGRRRKQGRVIIQTMDPEHPVIQFIHRGDYEGLYREQMEERQLFRYPPFYRMIRISFRHRIPSILDAATEIAGDELKRIFSSRVYGPQYPPVRKIHQTYIKQVILKIEREASYEKAKGLLEEVLDSLSENEIYRSIRITVDVDPH